MELKIGDILYCTELYHNHDVVTEINFYDKKFRHNNEFIMKTDTYQITKIRKSDNGALFYNADLISYTKSQSHSLFFSSFSDEIMTNLIGMLFYKDKMASIDACRDKFQYIKNRMSNYNDSKLNEYIENKKFIDSLKLINEE